ncbi:MAG: hypothetical protein M0D55_02300 [Elusimicrobiota bacterium]|nr:MAG: hypothetical protein M0D55_02300 [Elusimicrobiota bacterium]
MNPLGAAVAAVSLVGSLAGDSTNYWSVPPETRAALVESARKGFVELRFRFAPYDPASGVDQNRWWKTRSSYGADEMWQNRQSARLQGARASGGFFAAGLGDYDVEHLERLTAVDADGREHPARPWGVSRRGGMVWLKAEGLEDAPLPARAPFTVPEKGFSARLSARAPDSRVSVSAWSKPRPRNEAPFLRSFDRPGAPASPNSRLDESYDMLFDSSATWRGWIRGRGWDEDDELVDPESARKAALPWEDFLRARREAEKRASGALAVARLRFRPEAVDAVGLYGLSLASSDEDRERQVKTRVDVALPVGGGRLFVPTRLSPALVQRLESVELVRGGKATPARFVGVLKGPYEGWLLASDDAGPALGGGKETADDELMLAVEPRLSGESLRVRSFADRLDGWSYSYKESLRRKPRAASERGTLLCGLDGLPFAVIVEEARYENVVDRDSWRVPTPLLALHPSTSSSASCPAPRPPSSTPRCAPAPSSRTSAARGSASRPRISRRTSRACSASPARRRTARSASSSTPSCRARRPPSSGSSPAT